MEEVENWENKPDPLFFSLFNLKFRKVMDMYDVKFDLTNIANMEFPDGISIIDDVMDGYKNYQILSVALEFDIFGEIADNGPSSPRDIAKSALVNGVFIKNILIALEDMGLLKSNEDRYFLTEPAETFLLKESPLYQGDLILSAGSYKSQWNNLIAALLHQKGPVKSPQELDEFQIKTLAQQSIRGDVQKVVKEIASYPGFQEAECLLDVGGSPGLYSIALCQENNKLIARILEQDPVVQLTSSFVRRYGMENRIKVENCGTGNFKENGSREEFDIVLISNFLYKYPREIGEILENVSQILNPSGILVLNHRFINPNDDVKPGDGVRGIDQALSSLGHPLCHPKGLKKIIEELGFTNVSLIPYEIASGHAVLCIGIKEGRVPRKNIESSSKTRI